MTKYQLGVNTYFEVFDAAANSDFPASSAFKGMVSDFFVNAGKAKLKLELDGFELLDSSPVKDVLRDGDLVCVSAAHPSDAAVNLTVRGIKRKREEALSNEASGRVMRRFVGPGSPICSSTSISSSSSASTSTSSDSSSDASDSDDSDSENSSSSSSSRPQSSRPKLQTQTARRTVAKPLTIPSGTFLSRIPKPTIPLALSPILPKTAGNTDFVQHVPPGYGKPSTRSRNLRRRKRRQSQLSVLDTDSPNITRMSEANAMALGPGHLLTPNSTEGSSEASGARSADLGASQPTGSRLAKSGPAGSVASALNGAFGDNEKSGRLDPGILVSGSSMVAGSFTSKQAFPASVLDSEAELRAHMLSYMPKSKNKNKSRRKNPGAEGGKLIFSSVAEIAASSNAGLSAAELSDMEYVERRPRPRLIPPSELEALGQLPPGMFVSWVDVEAPREAGHMNGGFEDEDEEMSEKAGDVDEQKGSEEKEELEGNHDKQTGKMTWQKRKQEWRIFESAYPNLPLFSQKNDKLALGDKIGWMNLRLNMTTYTPELGLAVAHVAALSAEQITVKQIPRPDDHGGDEEDGEYNESDVEGEIHELSEIIQAGLKIFG